MRIILAFLLSLFIAILILGILYEPSKKQMYKQKPLHPGSEYNLAGLFLILYPILVIALAVPIYLIIP